MEKEVSAAKLKNHFVYGHGASNLTLICEEFTFAIHCDVFSQSSEVWDKMLNGAFAESLEETVTLHGDDPQALKLTLDIVYGLLSGEIDASSFKIDYQNCDNLETFVDKYDLRAVSTFLRSVRQGREQAAQLVRFQLLPPLQRREQEQRLSVRITDHPHIGARVSDPMCSSPIPRKGTIIAFNEQKLECDVRWDDGSVTRNLKCGTNGKYQVVYV